MVAKFSASLLPSLHHPQILRKRPLFINPLRFTNEPGAHCHLTHGSHATQIYTGRLARDCPAPYRKQIRKTGGPPGHPTIAKENSSSLLTINGYTIPEN